MDYSVSVFLGTQCTLYSADIGLALLQELFVYILSMVFGSIFFPVLFFSYAHIGSLLFSMSVSFFLVPLKAFIFFMGGTDNTDFKARLPGSESLHNHLFAV